MASVSYQIRIFDRENNYLTMVNDPFNFSWNKVLSKPGSLTFGMDTNDARATAANLKPFNRIELWRRVVIADATRATLVWRGYIEVIKAKSDQLSVIAQETLNLFSKRLTAASKTFATVDGGVAAMELLTDTNTNQDTLVDAGSEDITATVNLEFKRENVLSAWGKIAETAGGAEYEIRPSYTGAVLSEVFNFKSELGTDKSASIVFKYITGRPEEINLVDYEVSRDGADMANSVYALSSAAGTVEQNATDATSQNSYGLLESYQSDNDKTTDADVLASAQYEIDQNKDPLFIPQITPDTTKIDFDSYEVGDTIRLVIDRGYINIDQNHRILSISVNLGDNGDENITLQIAEIGKINTRENILASIQNLKQRISEVERTV